MFWGLRPLLVQSVRKLVRNGEVARLLIQLSWLSLLQSLGRQPVGSATEPLQLPQQPPRVLQEGALGFPTLPMPHGHALMPQPAAPCMQVEPRLAGGNAERDPGHEESLHYFREATSRPFLAAGGFKRDSAIEAVKEGRVDAVVFGECRCHVYGRCSRRALASCCRLPRRVGGAVIFCC